MRTWILGILLVIVGAALAIGLWLLGYHLSGKWAFNRWKAERVAMGDRLDWKDLVPPPVPADQNFAEAPLTRGSIVEKGKVDPRFKALEVPKAVIEALGNWQEGRRDDLEAIARAYGTKDLQSVVKPMESILRDLDLASRRPGSRFPIDYQEGEMPALIGFRNAMRTLRIRALANLRAGHPDQALEELQISLRIAEHLKSEPHLISALLRVAILNIAMQVVWEGTEDHLWTASTLQVIQGDLSRVDLLAASRLAWRGERQYFIECFTSVADNRAPLKFMSQERTQVGILGRGWRYRNLLEYSRFMSNQVETQDPATHRVFPERFVDGDQWIQKLRYRPDLVLAKIMIPTLSGQLIRFARAQALIDQAQVACALERHRLDKGQYPDRLEALAPAYLPALPHDLVTGGPLHYAQQGDTFTLYQVGWDGKDDGGTVAWMGEGKERKPDPAKGDWVWPHASR